MRRFVFFIILLLSFATSFSQVPQKLSTWYEFKLVIPDSLGLPRDTFPVPTTMRTKPWLSWKNDLLYTWSPTLLKWIAAGGAVLDSTGGVYATTSYVDQKANAVRNIYVQAPMTAFNDSTFGIPVATDAQSGYTSAADHVHNTEAYNKYVASGVFSGGTLTLTKRDGTTITVNGFGTGSGLGSIAGATDAQVVNPTGGQAFIFDATLAKWANKTFIPITLTNPSTSDVLAPNGSGTGAINVHAMQMDTTGIADKMIPYWKQANGKLGFEPIVSIDVTNATDGKVATWSAGKLVLATPTGGSGTSIDTTSLSNRINLKLNISDTANMLSPYLRKNVAAATYQPIGSYATTSQLAAYAPLASPALTGVPSAPTATAGTNTTQLATTAFVTAAVAASTTGVSSFVGRTGAVTALKADYSAFFVDLGGAYANPSWITSLAYSKLTSAPTIPTQTSQLTNNSGFMTSAIADGTSITGNGVSGTPLTVAANGVTYAKFQQMAASTLMGNPTGALSTPQAITLGTGLSFSGAVLNNTITNNNQLTNGSNFISSAAGLIIAGANVTLGGLGTAASPYVINAATGSGFANGTSTAQALFWNNTTYAPRVIAAGDIPTLNQNTTGTSANVTGTVAIANGGTGKTTQQLAINALTGTQVAGKYGRSDGTNFTLSSIVAADVPTLNQNTTGTAANVTGVVAIANGGNGNTTPGLSAGAGISMSGSWPNQTVSNTITNDNQLTNGANYITGVTYSLIGVTAGTRPKLNLIPQNNISFTASDDATNNQVNLTISGPVFVKSLVTNTGLTSLAGDADSPGASMVYSTDASGVKGWNPATLSSFAPSWSVSSNTNATLSARWSIFKAQTISASHTVTFPASPSAGDVVEIICTNSGVFSWSVAASASIVTVSGSTVSTVGNQTFSRFIYDPSGVQWIKVL